MVLRMSGEIRLAYARWHAPASGTTFERNYASNPSDTTAGSRHRALLPSGLPVTERRLQVAGVWTAVLDGAVIDGRP